MTFSLTPVSQVPPSEPDWLWSNRLARGTLTILEGDPGTNKSTFAYYLAAHISAGVPMPDCAAPTVSGDVWIVSTEDSAARTRANLAACGANLARIKLIQCDGGFRLPSSFADFAAAVQVAPPTLVTLDPLSECLDGAATSERSVRAALTPLCMLAQKYGFGILGLRHLGKAQSSNILYRGGGSIALIALSRSTLLVVEDPFQPGQRLLVQVKSSLGPISSAVAFKPIEKNGGLGIEWLGRTSYSSEQLVAAQRTSEARALEDAAYVLYSILGDGPLYASEALLLGRKSGVCDRTLRRAKSILGVKSLRSGFGRGSRFVWALPTRNELVDRLRDRDLNELLDKLFASEQRYQPSDQHGHESPPKHSAPESNISDGDEEGRPTDSGS